jgi:hypothetical protein
MLTKTKVAVAAVLIALLAVTAAVILAGIGAWVASTTQARVEAAPNVTISPLQLMMNSKDLPAEEFVDYSFVFN